MTETGSDERRASQYADATARQIAQLNDFLTWTGTGLSDIRFAATTTLNAEAGNKRKRQANLPTKSTRDVYDTLWRHNEQIYSRHGNSTFHAAPASPRHTGVMEQSVFARLAPNDFVVVVDPDTEIGRALLDGNLELPEPEAAPLGPDVWPITAIRVANARDTQAVRHWYLHQLAGSQHDATPDIKAET